VLSQWPYFHTIALVGRDYEWLIWAEIIAFQTGPPSSAAPHRPNRILANAAPNPFEETITIEWRGVPVTGIQVSIHDVTGRLLKSVVVQEALSGKGALVWDGTDAQGRRVPSGVYFLRAESAGAVETRKIVLLR